MARRGPLTLLHMYRTLLRLAISLALVPSARAELQRYEYSADAMGASFSIALYSSTRTTADTAAADAFAELRRLDHMLSNYLADSEWSMVNRSAAERPVKVSEELFNLISACLDYSRQGEGAFDITVGPLMKAWGFYNASGRLPDNAAVRAALAFVGYSHILLDASGRTIRFARAGVELDPGGIGKGYAVDCMIRLLKRNGIERALVSAAGSSIFALGSPPGEDGWPVRIRGPETPDHHIEPILLKDESLSTSAGSGKFFRAGNQIYGHILDPRTGFPAHGALLVSVVAPRAIDSEAWTKNFYVNGRLWSTRHIPAGFRVYFCEEGNDHSPCGWLP